MISASSFSVIILRECYLRLEIRNHSGALRDCTSFCRRSGASYGSCSHFSGHHSQAVIIRIGPDWRRIGRRERLYWEPLPFLPSILCPALTRKLMSTVKIVLLHGVCSPKILCIYTIMQLRRVLLLVTHCDLLRDVTDKPVLQSCPSRISNSLPSNLIPH